MELPLSTHPVYVVVGYHGLNNQCVAMRVANVMCILIIEGDIVHLPSELFGRLLVRRVHTHERSFLCFSEIEILGSSRLPGEVRSTENGPDFTRWSHLVLVVARLGASIVDVVLEIPFTDEFFDLILEHNALFSGMAEIFVISAILILISFGVVPS